jgi:myo-inositol-1(or 4)-monophosphatase
MAEREPREEELERLACEAARAGGAVLRERFRRDAVQVETKGVHDFVTEADRLSEAAVVACIQARFPHHAVMTEESAPATAAADHRWIIDPLDGTTNFIHGVATFGVSVALEDRRGLVAGAIYDPVHEELFHSRRGGGARLNGEPIRCSPTADPHQALIATGFPFRELGRVERYLEAFEAFIRTTAGLRRAGSACLDLAHTACGRYDGFWEIGLSRWDIAAGALIVQEAGGRVTDVLGGDRYLDSGDLVAAGAGLHATLLAVTRRAFG